MAMRNWDEYKAIVTFIKRKNEVAQAEIIRHFAKEWYHDIIDTNVRMKIGNRLQVLEEKGVIMRRIETHGNGIARNYWSVV